MAGHERVEDEMSKATETSEMDQSKDVPNSPAETAVSAFSRISTALRRPITMSADAILQEQAMNRKMHHYSTMRIHMKRVQYAMEQEKRNSFYKELVLYLVFLFILMLTICALPVHIPYELNESLRSLYLDSEFPNLPIKKTYEDVETVDDMWQWVQGPLLSSYYKSPYRNSHRITSVQFRTGRVEALSCQVVGPTNSLKLFPNELCTPDFSLAHEEMAPYGNNGFNQSFQYNSHLDVLPRSYVFTPSLWNSAMDYGTGGYAIYLPRDNASAAHTLVAGMKQSLVQPATRYVAATWIVYNHNADVFSRLQILFEMSHTDYIEKSARLESFRIIGYASIEAFFTTENIMMIFLALVTLSFTYRELSDLRERGLSKYLKSMWNVLDLVQLGFLYAMVFSWCNYIKDCHEILPLLEAMVNKARCDDVASAGGCFVDIMTVGNHLAAVFNISAALALISVAIVFKYLRLNTRLNMLWRTLRFAASDLVAFVFIFVFIFFGYAVMGFLLFGNHVRDYRSLSSSLAACFQMLLGAFDYASFLNSNPAMAGVFFFTYMVSIFLVLVNMFVAIISEYYRVAMDEKKLNDENKAKLLSSDSGKDTFYDKDAEYDLWMQAQQFLRGLKVKVKLIVPASCDKKKAPLALTGGKCVLLVDYTYLHAEKARLRAKFRAAIRVIRICIQFLKPLRKFCAEFDPSQMASTLFQAEAPARPRTKTLRHYLSQTERADFPVTYVPIHAPSAKVVHLVAQLRVGQVLEIDDMSLTNDRIGLEVLGDQIEYLRESMGHSPEAVGRDEDSFGLRHFHKGIGSGAHIRCCRVLYHGDTILEGLEECLLPTSTWLRHAFFAVGRTLWGVATCKWWHASSGTVRNHKISDEEIEQLLEAQFTESARGSSCRFDELVKQFRLFLAKKVQRGQIRVVNNNLEALVQAEAIAFVERFPKALMPLDKRELVGYKYVPCPTDTSHIRLPNSVSRLTELLAQNAHEVWSEGRIGQGWKWGPARDNDKKLHPDLVPYEALTEEDKQYDRDTSMSALKVIQALGYIMDPKTPSTAKTRSGRSLGRQASSSLLSATSSSSSMDESILANIDVNFGVAAPPGETYEPRPIHTEDVEIPPELNSLVELLAENTHDVWAQMRMSQGWKYGPQRDDDKREHNGLVPYVYLTPDEKQMDRNTAMQTVKLILRFGFTFRQKHEPNPDKAATKGFTDSSSVKFRMFGRSEDVSAENVAEAASVLLATNRAKHMFLSKKPKRPSPAAFSTIGRSVSHVVDAVATETKPPTAPKFRHSLSTPHFSDDAAVTERPQRRSTEGPPTSAPARLPFLAEASESPRPSLPDHPDHIVDVVNEDDSTSAMELLETLASPRSPSKSDHVV
ncbi:ryanodine-inositol 1,4,5-triphosphate receptor Ca2 channel (RIR-CaC) family protein [Achlya hypogyna]|uniref:Ryanodine-inositol 1,4,5-triphosphate receptor Ca2 channel (RIR-CaC) family protein n=1 Tax=Achlya hypogyna TaxID=1202772 RepID=A0A1V9YNP8_ACHHY|nr:ryanodine-inositol 1,4,5-triphosphate receptor Ca2 channel (RIR-CaC) family protein [Achlya hypogyna]